jgi:hypothetical protein
MDVKLGERDGRAGPVSLAIGEGEVSSVGSRLGGLRGCQVAEEEGPVRNYAIGEEGWVAVTVSRASDSPGGATMLGLITLKLAVGQSCRRPHMGLLAGRVRCQTGWWAWESSV